MRTSALAALIAVLAVAPAACTTDMAVGSFTDGGGNGADGGGDAYGSGGSGNGVLLVHGSVEATEESDNASTPDGFKGEIVVTVSRGGSPVDDAVVTVSSASGTITLKTEGQGSYQAELSDYDRRYELDVTAGSDAVHGVRAEGPNIHTIDNPTEGSRHTAGQALEVRWTAGAAQQVTVETDKMPAMTTTDSGVFTVSASYLTAEAGSEEKDRVRVRRANSQPIAGGAAGSDFMIRLRNQVEFVVVEGSGN